ncbi:hypothetical protein SDC9_87193 [bioreactor metagenome]|uniref:M23ase beta-sheet core domain-containing protein n=1 Tax=bioreactor metagenome TaxID=1076179 RepID=A0A644ZI91_9ZZZZ
MKKSIFTKNYNFSQKGFYIIMLVCILTIATAIYVISKSNEDIYKLENESDITQEVISEEPETNDILPVITEPVKEEEPKVIEKPEPEVKSESVPVSAPVKKTPFYVKPVSGDILCPFSLTELIYSNTMGDWRTHGGVDIKGSVGTQVKAMADGTVSDVYSDELYGQVIVIEHGDNLKSLYANLSESVIVKKGQKVSAGDVIGGIGETAMIEMAEPPHLHFETIKDGVQVDPFTYIK